jgi:segregation and condensation protein A
MSFSENPIAGDAQGPSDPVSSLASSGSGPYSVKLPAFEGPLDLLLHLIRQNEVEITDIPVALISSQYLEYLEIIKMLDLDVAGDYLVMAATLALIKSRMLLPPDGEEDDEEGLDPRAELVARLLEYQRYKEVAENLGKRRLLGRDVFAAQGPGLDKTPEEDREITVDLFELMEAFRQVLAATKDRNPGPHHVESETIRVRDRMVAVLDLLGTVDSIEFTQIFQRTGDDPPSRTMVVATFLAILELARVRGLHIYQGHDSDGAPEGVIRLRIVEGADPSLWDESVAEGM